MMQVFKRGSDGPIKELSQFTSDVGSRQCFGFAAELPCGHTVFAEYHGCGDKPRVETIFNYLSKPTETKGK